MKKTLFVAEQVYEAPTVQLLDFAVEQGFATSSGWTEGGAGGYDEDDTNDNGSY